MPLIEGFGDEVVCLLGFLISFVLVIFAWLSTRVVDGGTLVSVVLLDRERFTGLLQRVRDRVGVRAPAPLATSVSPTASVSTSNAQVAQSDPQTSEQLLVSELDSPPHPGEEESVITSAVNETEEVDVQPSQSFTLIDPITASGSISTDSDLLVSNEVLEFSEHDLSVARDEASDSRDNSSTTTVLPLAQSSGTSAQIESLESAPADGTATNFTPVEGHIRIKLQYVDGRQRMVSSHPDNTVGVFKRTEFTEQLTDGRSVRFVVNGQELRDESMTLRACSVKDGSVIHCLVSQPVSSVQSSPTETQRSGSRQWDLGVLMFPLFGCVLGALWYARVMYRVFFNAASTFSLIAISFLYIVGVLASWRNSNLPGHVHVE